MTVAAWDPAELEALAASRRADPRPDPLEFARHWAEQRPGKRRATALLRNKPRRRPTGDWNREEKLAALAEGFMAPGSAREVIDAVRAGILSPEEGRWYLGHGAVRAATASDGPAEHRRLLRLLWGVAWRYAAAGGVFLAAAGFAWKPDLLLLVGYLVAGLLLGLSHRHRFGLGPLWRVTGLAALTAYVFPGTWPELYPAALCGLAFACVAGAVLSLRERR